MEDRERAGIKGRKGVRAKRGGVEGGNYLVTP